jgi:hypothetical protein
LNDYYNKSSFTRTKRNYLFAIVDTIVAIKSNLVFLTNCGMKSIAIALQRLKAVFVQQLKHKIGNLWQWNIYNLSYIKYLGKKQKKPS